MFFQKVYEKSYKLQDKFRNTLDSLTEVIPEILFLYQDNLSEENENLLTNITSTFDNIIKKLLGENLLLNKLKYINEFYLSEIDEFDKVKNMIYDQLYSSAIKDCKNFTNTKINIKKLLQDFASEEIDIKKAKLIKPPENLTSLLNEDEWTKYDKFTNTANAIILFNRLIDDYPKFNKEREEINQIRFDEEHKFYESELSKLRTKLTQKEADLSKCRKELSGTKEELRECKDEIYQCKEKLLECQKELSRRKNEPSKSKEELSESKDELSESKDELSESKDELSESKDELSQSKDEPSKFKEELSQCKEKITQYQNKLKECEEEISESKKELSNCQSEISQYKNILLNCEKEKEEYKAMNEKLNELLSEKKEIEKKPLPKKYTASPSEDIKDTIMDNEDNQDDEEAKASNQGLLSKYCNIA